jgi:uncharacterized membrane protein
MRRPISWGRVFAFRQYARGSLWIAPLVGGLIGAVAGALDSPIERSVSLPHVWQYSSSTASTVLATIVGALVGLTGFVVTVSVLVVQMATGTFSARYMRLWYRDRVLKALLAVLVGTTVFSLTLLRRVESDFVPNLGVTLAGTLVVIGLLLFLIFLDRFIHRLRPVAVTEVVARLGRRALLETTRADGAPSGGEAFAWAPNEEPALIVSSPSPGAIQAIDTRGLVRWARERDCLLHFPHGVGDFVESGQKLVEVFGDLGDSGREAVRLQHMVALGIERTIEQDPAFAVRIMVDIAIKALSPAVNDPTTAVQVLDHLGETLRVIGTTDLIRQSQPQDESGEVRLLLPARRWDDYLALGVTEIREYGANSVQVVRRLRALLEDLLVTVRPEYRRAVEDELARLDATVAEQFADSVDLDRACFADHQGLGGPTPFKTRAVR